MSPIVAIFAAPNADGPAATEFLRVLVALRALDRALHLCEIGRGVGVLSRDPTLSPDGDRYLEALAEDGVVPRAGADLATLLAAAEAVVVLPDPDRAGTPPVLCLRRGVAPDAATLAALPRVGQVVLDPSP